jgi:hypothetical protein
VRPSKGWLGCGAAVGVVAALATLAMRPQLRFRLQVDEEQLAAECAWLRLTKPPGEYLYYLSPADPGYQALPPEVRRTRARVSVGHEAVTLEFGGGFHHYGLYVGPPPRALRNRSVGYAELGSGVWYYDERWAIW